VTVGTDFRSSATCTWSAASRRHEPITFVGHGPCSTDRNPRCARLLRATPSIRSRSRTQATRAAGAVKGVTCGSSPGVKGPACG